MAGAEVRGISTYQTYLMVKKTSAGSYEKVCDITSFPDLVPPAERIDITSLSDAMRVYIKGIGDTSEMTFAANFTPENFESNNTVTPDGHNGKFSWTGDISVGVTGGGVNEAVSMNIVCTPSTEIVATFT